jgi:hypothetical protein
MLVVAIAIVVHLFVFAVLLLVRGRLFREGFTVQIRLCVCGRILRACNCECVRVSGGVTRLRERRGTGMGFEGGVGKEKGEQRSSSIKTSAE